jgi:Fur family ferric uptake transcriptional regulator
MNIKKLIKDKGLSLTQAREELIDLLLKANEPLCYEDLKKSLSMDKATFYRNIALFEEVDIVNSFESNDKKRYYSIEQNLHPHFICTCCNSIECLHEDAIYKLKGYKIESITIKGLCPHCKK